MTRAEKRLYLTWARYRRRYGNSQPEVCLPSRFLNEVPPSLRERLSPFRERFNEDVDLFAEQADVRESVKKNLFTGRTYNSVDNIAQFFAERGMPPPSGLTKRPQNSTPATPPVNKVTAQPETKRSAAPEQPRIAKPAAPSVANPVAPRTANVQRPSSSFRGNAVRKQAGIAAGSVIRHPVYGRGTVLRREGDGEDAKLTISFPGHGLKKIVEKYAGIQIDE
jgi:DNA helicase-2/ATP-dependent DNA helicase PcrA